MPRTARKAIQKEEAAPTKRRLSAYIIFSQEKRESVIKEFGFNKSQIGPIAKKLGEMWKASSQSEKEAYKAKAATL
jgi:hypothetical protein